MILYTETGPLDYEVAGSGPPLAFVSGWAMSRTCWRPAVEILRRKYRCLIYDARGVGRSQPATQAARFEIEDHAEDLHAVLSAAGMHDAALIAHETGTMVASLAAARHPQDVRALILVSPRAAVGEDEINRLAVFTPASLALRELAQYPLIRTLVAWRFRRAPQPWRDALFNDFAAINPRAAYDTAQSAAMPEAFDLLDRVATRGALPLLLLCGDQDKKAVKRARLLFARARAAKLATMKDCGFLPMLEYPLQFARLTDGFLGALPAPGGPPLAPI